MKYCPKCGKKLNADAKFCSSCGEEIAYNYSNNPEKISSKRNMKSINAQTVFSKINKDIEIKNNQTSITKKLWYTAAFFLVIIIVAFLEIISIHPAIVMLSFFFFLSSVLVGFMFRSREKKLQKLISGENLLAEWTLSDSQKKIYVDYLFKHEVSKNMIILLSISTIAIIVFGIFILVIDEGKFAMFLVLLGLILFLSFFAFGMPYYYRMKNSRGDGHILIGAKYAYLNGYFHNWDFILSGLSRVKTITEPFYGINLVYYYTDRTLTHSGELFIPANKEVELEELIKKLKEFNPKRKRKK